MLTPAMERRVLTVYLSLLLIAVVTTLQWPAIAAFPVARPAGGMKIDGSDFLKKIGIYGYNNFQNLHEVTNPILYQAALSTVALVPAQDLKIRSHIFQFPDKRSDEAADFLVDVLGLLFGADSPTFEGEPIHSFSTGFLITPTHILTTGHSASTQEDCDKLAIVFEYAYFSPDDDLGSKPLGHLYYCKQIVAGDYLNDERLDFTIIELKRAVRDRWPLPLRSFGQPRIGDELASIGTPRGVPLKVAPRGYVLKVNEFEIETSLDAAAGNSGGPGVNTQTGVVEGIASKSIETENKSGVIPDCPRRVNSMACTYLYPAMNVTRWFEKILYFEPMFRDSVYFSDREFQVISEPEHEEQWSSSFLRVTEGPFAREIRIYIDAEPSELEQFEFYLAFDNGFRVQLGLSAETRFPQGFANKPALEVVGDIAKEAIEHRQEWGTWELLVKEKNGEASWKTDVPWSMVFFSRRTRLEEI